jgi:hypothetical protein
LKISKSEVLKISSKEENYKKADYKTQMAVICSVGPKKPTVEERVYP